MPSAPLVSIVTPARNAAATLGASIESARCQSLPDWEMLIVDDASDDDTAALARRHAAEDSRICLLSQSRRGGVAAARNAALAEARGRFVAFLDADDLWRPEKLARQTRFMAAGGFALGYTAFRRFSASADKPGRLIQVPPRLTYDALLKNTAIASVTAMVDRSLTGPIRFSDLRHEDYALWLSLLKRGLTAGGLNEDLARYRVNKTSLSGRKLQSAFWVWQVYRDVEGLGLMKASWCLAHYGLNALRKRLALWP
ncbi:MAG TPA: glycosyltransferase family 2 protein [Kiloniellaceae bacterium]|nr:glycosyltransferase family 2 protein [Kiloniellaceae bacterium]